MKAESSTGAARQNRTTVYARPSAKRASSSMQSRSGYMSPSACGVQKSRSRAPSSAFASASSSSAAATLDSPRKINATSHHSPSTRVAIELQRQRQLQIISLEREVRSLLEEEYRQDVTEYMHQIETVTMCSPASMDMQPEIQWHMRACLIEFLIEVHLNFRLRPETLYLTCNIVDRYVSRRVVYKRHYQLVGCAALWIASKFEDAKERVPTIKDLCEICRNEYDESAFIQMEGHILATIAWRIGHPTAEAWLRVACCGVQFEDAQTQHVARFLMEVTLFYRDYVHYPPSVLAQAALLLARYTLGKSRRPFEETELVMTVVKLLDQHLGEELEQLSQMLVKKYSYSYYSKASTHIVQWYLQGGRYVQEPLLVPVSPLVSTSSKEVPSTPVNKTTYRVQAWPSGSSISSTPSFSGSDSFSSEMDEPMPETPSSSTADLHAIVDSSMHIDPLVFNAGMSLGGSNGGSSTHTASASTSSLVSTLTTSTTNTVHGAHASSNKENRPVVVADPFTVNSGAMVAQQIQSILMSEGTTRSRKSSFEVAPPSSAGAQSAMLDGTSMDLCQPSPASREATYIPRPALNALAANNA